MNIDLPTDLIDPQDCPECLALADICPYHQGWADGWDTLANTVGLLVTAIDQPDPVGHR